MDDDELTNELPDTIAAVVRMLLSSISLGDRSSKKINSLLFISYLERLLRTTTESDPYFDKEIVPSQLYIEEYLFDFPFVITTLGAVAYAKRNDFGDNANFSPIWIQLTLGEDMKRLRHASIYVDTYSPYQGDDLIISAPRYSYDGREKWKHKYEITYECKSQAD